MNTAIQDSFDLGMAQSGLAGHVVTRLLAGGNARFNRCLVNEISTALLGPGWQDAAAWLVVVSSALIAAKDTFNWLTGVKDEFAEKPKTAAPLGALGALAETIGVGIFVVGVLTAL